MLIHFHPAVGGNFFRYLLYFCYKGMNFHISLELGVPLFYMELLSF